MVCVCWLWLSMDVNMFAKKIDLYKVSAPSGLTSIFFWYVLTCD